MQETELKEVSERVDSEKEESEKEVILPIPNPAQRLPRPLQNREEETDDHWDMAAEYRGLRRDEEQGGDDKNVDAKEDEEEEEEEEEEEVWSISFKRPLPGVAVVEPMSQGEPFSFLTRTPSAEQLGDDDESESGGSQSEGSVSAASISGLSLAAAGAGYRRAVAPPGPWLTPSGHRPAQYAQETYSRR
ncbi:chromo domain-containing protein cec-1-like [Cololabis saira]|uniref:chromo domain-containing protein cec-1-like n=1 Tax=Cololabis saira TaxID=129043 RepID=UPI002AD35755|nr:chromo domain-containing protein cec-1-like [Cololabis saira]